MNSPPTEAPRGRRWVLLFELPQFAPEVNRALNLLEAPREVRDLLRGARFGIGVVLDGRCHYWAPRNPGEAALLLGALNTEAVLNGAPMRLTSWLTPAGEADITAHMNAITEKLKADRAGARVQ